MLFERQRTLLTLLDALGGRSAPTDFQKLLFLYTRGEDAPTYEFVPYKFGCFSFTCYADRRKLVEKGYLADEEDQWAITPAGREVVRCKPVQPLRVRQFCRANATLRGNALIAKVYQDHPYYATRSVIASKVLTDAAAQERIRKARPAKAGPGLATIGYEGKCLETYLNQLLRAGVTLLCDVRRNPLSRKFGFSKSTLSNACEGVGIRYEHLPQLGIASDQRRELNSQDDYDALFAEYERKSLPRQTAALVAIQAWIEAGERVALTCFELHPHQCHRHCVAEALVARSGHSLKAQHL